MRTGPWRHVSKCNNCGNIQSMDANFYAAHDEPCPTCGEIDWIEDVVARRVFATHKWWRPSTWNKFEWQLKEESDGE